MNIGMLWYSPDKTKTLPEKIGEAVAFYRSKYGGTANVCFVNPQMIGEPPPTVPGMTVKTSKSVMPNHFWVGVE